jgi:starvation-inducible DNA-binding protein
VRNIYLTEGSRMEYHPGDRTTVFTQVVIQPNLGLDANNREAIVALLNVALSDEILLATKTRCLHWNARGTAFFELHALFAAQYQQLCSLSDEIAERVRILGGVAFGSMRAFLEHTRLEEQPGEVPDILHLLADHEAFIRLLREDARQCANEYEDEGSRDLLVTSMRVHEKIAWMLRSSIEIGNNRS